MKLYLNTVSDLLFDSLKKLMQLKEFNDFRLVGGTSLSLQLGHRESVDIDLFTDAEYGSVDFNNIEAVLNKNFPYMESLYAGNSAIGKSFFIGNTKDDLVKLDMFYTDKYVFPQLTYDNIRMASVEEITAMKLEVIGQGGRKKDFWDLHEILDKFTLDQMIQFYLKKYPYGYTKSELLNKLIDFRVADDNFTPNCFRDKNWKLIKLDFEELISK